MQHSPVLLGQQPSSPGPAYSDSGMSGRQGSGGFSILQSLKKALPHSPRAHSPTSSFGGSEMGTPPSRSKLGFPSFSNGQRKRETIRKLEDDVGVLQMQLHQRDSQLTQLQQQVAAESRARMDAQERLNMQYFKSHLLVDMLVAQLLQHGDAPAATLAAAAPAPTAAAAPAGAVAAVAAKQQLPAAGAQQQQQQQQQQWQLAAGPAGGMMVEDSFE